MTEEIRFQWWLGVGHTGLTSVDSQTALSVCVCRLKSMSADPRNHSPLFRDLTFPSSVYRSHRQIHYVRVISLSARYKKNSSVFIHLSLSLLAQVHCTVCSLNSVSLRLFLKMNFLNRREVFPSLLVFCLKLWGEYWTLLKHGSGKNNCSFVLAKCGASCNTFPFATFNPIWIFLSIVEYIILYGRRWSGQGWPCC